MPSETSIVKQTERAFDDFLYLWRRRKSLCVTIAGIIIAPLLYAGVQMWIDISIRDENKSLESQLDILRQERDAKAAQLAPFLAVANQRFAESPDAQRLDKLLAIVEHLRATTDEAFARLPLQRTVSKQAAALMIDALKSKPPIPVNFGAVTGDIESFGLAKQLAEIFMAAGWQDVKLGYANANRNPRGMQVLSNRSIESDLRPILSHTAGELGLALDFSINDDSSGTWIIVGGPER